MKVLKLVCMLIDHDELGVEQCVWEVRNASYPNHWCGPQVISYEAVEIGEWDEDHPANGPDRDEWFRAAFQQEARR